MSLAPLAGCVLLAAGVAAGVPRLDPLVRLELAVGDLWFGLRNAWQAPAPPDDLVIVGIDDASYAELGLPPPPSPPPRLLQAELIRALDRAGASVIAFDVLFLDRGNDAEDGELERAIAESGKVVLAEDLAVVDEAGTRREQWLRPLDRFLEPARGSGLVPVVVDPDGAVRRAYLALDLMVQPSVPSFGLAIAEARRAALGRPVADPVRDFGLPARLDTPLVVNYLGPPRTFRTVSLYQALEPSTYLPPGFFRDKVVLVGLDLAGAEQKVDHFSFPFRGRGRAPIPGVEIHASIVDTLLRQRFLRPVSERFAWGCALALLAVSALAAWRWPRWQGAVATLGLMLLVVAAAATLFVGAGRQLPVLPSLVGLSSFLAGERIWKLAVVDREKRFVQRAFKHYVAPAVVDQILADPGQLQLGGAWYDTTVVFTDLVGFTALAEGMEPMVMRRFLTDYFSEMVDIMLANRGTLDKFIGDALMCFFGVPVVSREHHLEGARTAWRMWTRLAELNRRWAADGLPPLSMRIGVNSGRVVAGNMGTRTLFNFTIMGDCVNTGSRLEGANKFYGTHIMIGEATAAHLGGEFLLRRLDCLRAKGKGQALTVFELIGPHAVVNERRARQVALYEEALSLYDERRFAAAAERFTEVLAAGPDGPASVLLARCRTFVAHPPAADWDGVHELAGK